MSIILLVSLSSKLSFYAGANTKKATNVFFFCFVSSFTEGWWTVTNFGEITGTVAIEMGHGTYISALDNGLFTLGAPHKGWYL